MIKFGICSEIFEGWEMEKAMQYAKDVGYDGIEIAPFTIAQYVTEISAEKRAEIRSSAEKVGIEITGIHWVLVKAEGMYMTHPDAEVRNKTADYFVELVKFCDDLGGKRIIVGSPYQRNLMEGVSYEQAWDWAVEVFKPAVSLAAEKGIVICFEPLAPAETNFINTAEEAVRFAKQFSSEGISVILDVKAMSSESKTVPEVIKATGKDCAYFHANDANLKGPGFGDVDFVPIATALKEVDYDGYVSVEVFKFEEGAEVIASKSIEYLRSVFS